MTAYDRETGTLVDYDATNKTKLLDASLERLARLLGNLAGLYDARRMAERLSSTDSLFMYFDNSVIIFQLFQIYF